MELSMRVPFVCPFNELHLSQHFEKFVHKSLSFAMDLKPGPSIPRVTTLQ